MVTFEWFDSDGSGNIDAHGLGLMLRDLSIPMTHEEVLKLADEMDEDWLCAKSLVKCTDCLIALPGAF